MYKNIAPVLKTKIDFDAESFLDNKSMMLDKIKKLNSLLEQAKDAISATNERQKSMPPKELKVTKQSPHSPPKQKKGNVAA